MAKSEQKLSEEKMRALAAEMISVCQHWDAHGGVTFQDIGKRHEALRNSGESEAALFATIRTETSALKTILDARGCVEGIDYTFEQAALVRHQSVSPTPPPTLMLKGALARAVAESPKTVAEVLTKSMQARRYAGNKSVSLYDIKGADCDDFLIRAKKSAAGGIAGLRKRLVETSSLTIPDFFFVGPKVSQSLLNFGDNLFDNPDLEIVPKHHGKTFDAYCEGGAEKKLSLMQRYLDTPEDLRELFEQAAFVGMQPYTHVAPDFNGDNVMVDAQLNLSLIDRVPQSDISRYGRQHHADAASNQGHAIAYVADLKSRLGHMCTDISGYDEKGKEVAEAFSTLLDSTEQQVKEIIESNTLLSAHPTWKGFQRATPDSTIENLHFEQAQPHSITRGYENSIRARLVSAVKLSDPPAKLKLALERLYAAAVPEAPSLS